MYMSPILLLETGKKFLSPEVLSPFPFLPCPQHYDGYAEDVLFTSL